LLEMKLLM